MYLLSLFFLLLLLFLTHLFVLFLSHISNPTHPTLLSSIHVSPQSRRQQDPSPCSHMANTDVEHKMRWSGRGRENEETGCSFSVNTIQWDSVKRKCDFIRLIPHRLQICYERHHLLHILKKRKCRQWHIVRWNIRKQQNLKKKNILKDRQHEIWEEQLV